MRRARGALCLAAAWASAGCGDELFTYEVRLTPASGAEYTVRVDDATFGPGIAFLVVRGYANYETGQDEVVRFESLDGTTPLARYEATPGECGRLCAARGCDPVEVTLEQVTLVVEPGGGFALSPIVHCVVGGDVVSAP